MPGKQIQAAMQLGRHRKGDRQATDRHQITKLKHAERVARVIQSPTIWNEPPPQVYIQAQPNKQTGTSHLQNNAVWQQKTGYQLIDPVCASCGPRHDTKSAT